MDVAEEVTVEAEAPLETATARTLDRADVATFPARSPDELLRAIPGLHLSAHGGTGKALQILLRGFDAAHGSDLAVSVEGVPMNEPSNVHGQGYLDLHFLPSVLVDGLDLVKGSYRAADGDFAITGSADYRVGLAPEGLLVETSAGTDRSGRGLAAWRPAGRGPGTFLVAEAEGGIGVGEGRRYGQLRAAAGIDGSLGPWTARAMAFAYRGTFESPGVLRLDDVEEQGFYGAYDEAGGGVSSRALAIGRLHSAALSATAWAGARELRLDQNFSGYLQDPLHGDGTRQAEVAFDAGARLAGHHEIHAFGAPQAIRAGADVRWAAVDQTEQAVTPDGTPWDETIDADVRHLNLAGWSDLRLQLGDRVTLAPGIRVDHLALASREDGAWARSAATVASPKVSGTARLGPVTGFAAYGRGFRSPEGRGIADGDRAPVMQSDSAELGAALDLGAARLQAAAFQIWIGDELVFDHLAARFLSAGRTRRQGVEAVLDLAPLPWLRVQADATYTDGRFVDDGTPIPYAPRWLGAVGAYAQGAPLLGGTLSGGLRAWALGSRPLPSGFASRPALVGTWTGALAFRRFHVGVEVDNLFGGRWRDGEFVFPSWFDRSAPRSERKELHITAGTPFAARLVLGVRPLVGG